MPSSLFTRRAWLARAAGAAAAMPAMVPIAARAAKISKKEAGYQDHPGGPGMECARCANYLAATSHCRVVEGTVSPHGYCGFFTAKG